MRQVAVKRREYPDIPEVLKLRIYEVVRAVPPGTVATYGDVATIVGGGCDAQIVGFALNAIPKTADDPVPWQRIINAQGGISTKGLLQRKLLEDEGIVFEANGRLSLPRFRWSGPTTEWAAEHGFTVLPASQADAGEQLGLF
jgi:methylated-DNA-protein-cysteine methyltransferase-like protein